MVLNGDCAKAIRRVRRMLQEDHIILTCMTQTIHRAVTAHSSGIRYPPAPAVGPLGVPIAALAAAAGPSSSLTGSASGQNPAGSSSSSSPPAFAASSIACNKSTDLR